MLEMLVLVVPRLSSAPKFFVFSLQDGTAIWWL